MEFQKCKCHWPANINYTKITFLHGSIFNNIEFGPVNKQDDDKNFPFSNLLDADHPFHVVQWVVIDGIKYVSKKCFILLNCNEKYEFVQVHTS